MSYICACCGHKSNAAASGSCSDSPTRSHIYMQEARNGYICK